MSCQEPFFYLAARSFTHTSAGIRAMHILCDQLNQFGFNAYLIGIDNSFLTHSKLNTPVLTRAIHDNHFKSGRKVVSVYDESIVGNPIKGNISVTWLLNRSGFSAGRKKYKNSERDMEFVYAKEIDHLYPRLFVNTVDYDFYREYDKKFTRNIDLFYAGKIKALGVKVKKPENSIEIFRTGPKKQSREELRTLFSQARVLFLAEDSALALEAAICGCPTIHMNKYFLDSPMMQEDGGIGLVADDNPKTLAEVNLQEQFLERYMATLELRTFNDVIKFALITQARSKSMLNQKKSRFKFPTTAKYSMKIGKALAGYRYSGFRGLLGVFSSHITFRKNGF